jgi:uncharacterized protein (UPF0333 family)
MAMHSRAQVGLEYLVLVAFLLVIIGFVFSYALTSYQMNSDVANMKSAVDSLASSANQVYALGPGNIMYVQIVLSENIQSYSLSGKTVSYTALVMGSSTEFYSETKPNLEGSLPISSGRHIIKIESLENSVRFSEYTG